MMRRRTESPELELAKNEVALTITGQAHEPLELFSEISATDRPSGR